MRTRFLNTDCFTFPCSSPVETLSFLNLAVSHPPPPPSHLSFSQQDLLSSSSFPPHLTPSLQFERFPAQNVISKFLQKIIPHSIDVQIGALHEDQQCCGASNKRPKFTSPGYEAPFSEKDEETVVDDQYKHWYKAFQFETPELDEFLESSSITKKEELQILSEVAEIESNQDILKPGDSLPFPYEVEDSVYLVENIALDYHMDHNPYSLEAEGSIQESLQNKFPLLEVDETSLGTLMQPSMKDEFVVLLENIESKHWTQNNELLIKSNELLGSLEHNMLEILLDDFPMNQCLESEEAFPDMQLQVDFVRMVEASHINGNSSFCQGPSDGSYFLSLNPVVFEEYLIVNIDLYQPLNVYLNMLTMHVPEICDQMFGEEMSFKNFNELVVIHELAHVDETFISLPVPVLSGHEKVMSLYDVAVEILSDIKPLPLSASNGIYLDWGLLEEDRCKFKDYSSSWNIMEVECESIDFDLSCYDRLLFDLLLSDDTLSAKNKECKESLNMGSDGSFLVHGNPNEVHPNMGNGCAKQKAEEEVSERASLFFRSMSEFNDLDFFLNRQKDTEAGNDEHAVKPFSSHASFSKVLTNDSKAVSVDEVEACTIAPQALDASFKVESEPSVQHMASFSGVVIILNTQTFDKEMIVSRRTVYQRVLALEKEGAQVLERDSDLPVDIILSSASCLVWYDCRNIGKKATTQDEASSGLPSYIENIATNVLTLLSFTFSSCILVFEGDVSFLTTIMESSDGLYAAASTLGLKLQLFCSYSSELTDEIILSSICCSSKVTRDLYPKMPESENLAESFLTKFPSINPLTAHAILSCGAVLIEFLEWSYERRIYAVQKYHVPEESIRLLSALCRYGEREDAKSILADCSSSVSSGLNSENCEHKVDSESKRLKFSRKPHNTDTSLDDLLHLHQFQPSQASQPFASWMLKDALTFNDMDRPSLSSSDNCRQKQGSKDRMDISRSKVSRTFNSQILGGSQEYEGLDKAMMNNLGWSNINYSDNQIDDLTGTVTDLTDSPLNGEDISSIANSMDFSPSVPEMENDSTRKPKTVRRLLFGQDSHPTFPINSYSEPWSYIKDQSLDLELGGYVDLCRNKLFEEGFTQRSTENLPFQHQEALQTGGTPLSKAIHSTNLPQGSPWTMEFLNRIREKSRLRPQSVSCDTFDQFSGIMSKAKKRKSPSILDFFKYQGGRTTNKAVSSKRPRCDLKSSSSFMKEKASGSHFASCTPVEKRARQPLSFAMDENGSQTKLVWSDGKGRALNKRLLNHT